MPADGSSVPALLYSGEERLTPQAWIRDGRFLLYGVSVPGGTDMWTLPAEGGEPEPFYEASGAQYNAAVHPNERWVAYQSSETGRAQVWVQPFPATGAKYPITTDGGHAPLWSPDGKELFYRNSRYELVSVAVDIEDFAIGRPEPLPVTGTVLAVNYVRNFDITPNGQNLLVILPLGSTEAGEPARPQINIIFNWFEELKERVPVP